MKYMMLIYMEEKALSDAEREKCYRESVEYARKLHETNRFLGAGPLQPTSMATTVRVQEGKRLVTDGPFAETREQLGGYFLVEAKDLDEALDIAGQIPAGRWGCVEVRPIIEVHNLPGK